jgi:hypothetical protein
MLAMYCFNDSLAEGEYFSLDLNQWEEINYSMLGVERLNIGRQYHKKDVRIFIQLCSVGQSRMIDNFVLFDRKSWTELRRVRGDKKGYPLEINSNGAIWIGDRFNGNTFKVFIKKES